MFQHLWAHGSVVNADIVDQAGEEGAGGKSAADAEIQAAFCTFQAGQGLGLSIEELKQRLKAAGEEVGARIRVSDRMEARLSGSNFAITAVTPEVQAVSRNDVTKWKWEIKPKSHGPNLLHLTLSVIFNVDGTVTPRAIRTFDRTIEVDVTFTQRVGTFFKGNWQWLWAAILLPIGGLLWTKRKKKAMSRPSDDS